MPPSQATSSQNTYIERGVGSPLVYTEIAEVVSIGGPSVTSEEIDITHLRSPAGYREFLQSFKDSGELPLELNFLPAHATQDETTGLRNALDTGSVDTYRITFPITAKTATFLAFVKAFTQTANVGEKLAASVTLRVSGVVTWA